MPSAVEALGALTWDVRTVGLVLELGENVLGRATWAHPGRATTSVPVTSGPQSHFWHETA